MKKIFEYLGLISLIVFSFFITEKTAVVVQEIDEIMVQIKDEMVMYNMSGMNAEIEGDMIVPGLVDKVVNVDKSYQNMKEKGLYDASFYIYDEIKPTISLDDNLDKYIASGNTNKKMVSLVFLVNNKNISEVQEVIGQTPASYVFENYNFDKQIDSITVSAKMNNDILIKAESEDNYKLLKNKLTSLNIDLNYCYNDTKNNEFLKICSKDNKYSLAVSDVITNNPLMRVKRNIKAGSVFVFEINDEVLEELPNMISYIQSRGYTITTLKEHLSENW